MNCPKCGGEMEEGFLSLTLPVLMEWVEGRSRPETERVGANSTLRYEPGIWRDYVKSFRCFSCRLITFGY